jgi:hypothetical protein
MTRKRAGEKIRAKRSGEIGKKQRNTIRKRNSSDRPTVHTTINTNNS